MAHEPISEDIFEMMCNGSAIPLSEVKKHPHGALFEECRETVAPREEACTARLELADAAMLAQLAEVRAEDPLARRQDRRATFRSCWSAAASRKPPTPPRAPTASSAPATTRCGCTRPTWPVSICATATKSNCARATGRFPASSRRDATLREGIVAMTHGFGPKPTSNYDPRRDGSNINLLLRWEDDPDPYHGMPRMSAVPVAVKAKAEVA